MLYGESLRPSTDESGSVSVAAIQPNVPIDGAWDDSKFVDELLLGHVSLSEQAIQANSSNNTQEKTNAIDLVIWPESPMNFTYSSNKTFQEFVANFTRQNHTSLLFNSLEPAPNDGSYNSALLINEEGQRIAQYDKIRLMPFGEYVPLPQWLPGASLISGIVGEFTPLLLHLTLDLLPVSGNAIPIHVDPPVEFHREHNRPRA